MKKINLNSVAFLVLGVFLLVTPALSQTIITSLVTAFYRNIDLLVWVNLAQNFWILNLLPKVVGAALVAGFAWKHLKTRFKVDLPKIKVQTTRLATYSLLFMLCAGLFLFADVPISEAATTATTGYILDTPISEYDWLVGQYSNGNYYAINGSNWDNLVGGVGSTAWSSYTSNSTALMEQVLAACTSGHILLKDVEFDYDLVIPENVAVTERNNGLDRTFINSANSQGSPYTISVDTVQTGYYMAQDSMGRFIDDFTSTNATEVFENTIQSNIEIIFSSGTYTLDSAFLVTSLNNIALTFTGSTINLVDGANTSAIIVYECENILIQNPTINGNGPNQDLGSSWYDEPSGIFFQNCNNSQVNNAYIYNTRMVGFETSGGGIHCGITNSKIENCGWQGIQIGRLTTGGYAINNEVSGTGDVGINVFGQYATISHNWIYDIRGTNGYNNAQRGIMLNVFNSIGSSNIVSNNKINNTLIGIELLSVSNCTVSNNIISESSGSDWQSVGLRVYDANYNFIENNKISSGNGWGIYAGGTNNIYSNNVAWNNGSPTSGNYGFMIAGNYNIFSSNYAYDTRESAARLQIGGFTVDAGATSNILSSNHAYNNNNWQLYDAGNDTIMIGNFWGYVYYSSNTPNSTIMV